MWWRQTSTENCDAAALDSKKLTSDLLTSAWRSLNIYSVLFLNEILLSPPFSTVCHHWDHRNLGFGWVPQVFEEAQTALHPGLLHLLLHPGISNDHRGMKETLIHLFFEWNIFLTLSEDASCKRNKGLGPLKQSNPTRTVWRGKHGGAEENVKRRLISGIFCVLNRTGCTCCSWWTRLQPLTRWSLLPFLSWWEFHTFMVSQSDTFTFLPPGGALVILPLKCK